MLALFCREAAKSAHYLDLPAVAIEAGIAAEQRAGWIPAKRLDAA